MLIKSQIWDNEQLLLPGAKIVEKGTSNATVSDESGRFEINVASADSELVVSYIGYDFDTFRAGDIDNKIITLWPAANMLDDVNIPNNYSNSNAIWWFLGLTALTVAALVAMKQKPQTKLKTVNP